MRGRSPTTDVQIRLSASRCLPDDSAAEILTLGRSKQRLRLRHEPSSVVPADVAVPGDPQQVQRHIVGRACGNRFERSLVIGEMTAVFPEEMPDERLRAVPVADGTHERMLKLACDPPDIEHPVPALHAFQIDRRDVHAMTEQKVRRSRVTVQPDLLVPPHLRPVPPAVAQRRELVDVPLYDPAGSLEPADDRVEVPAVGIEIDARTVRRPDVLRGEEECERFQPPIEVSIVPVVSRARDRVAKFLAAIVFYSQHPIDVAAQTQRANHVMRRPDQVVSAQRLEPFVLLACHPGCLVPVRSESRPVELADDLRGAELLLVRVDLVAAGQPEDAKRWLWLAHPQAIANDPAEEVVQRVMTGDVSDILSVHREPFLAPAPRQRASNTAMATAADAPPMDAATRSAPAAAALVKRWPQDGLSCSLVLTVSPVTRPPRPPAMWYKPRLT